MVMCNNEEFVSTFNIKSLLLKTALLTCANCSLLFHNISHHHRQFLKAVKKSVLLFLRDVNTYQLQVVLQMMMKPVIRV